MIGIEYNYNLDMMSNYDRSKYYNFYEVTHCKQNLIHGAKSTTYESFSYRKRRSRYYLPIMNLFTDSSNYDTLYYIEFEYYITDKDIRDIYCSNRSNISFDMVDIFEENDDVKVQLIRISDYNEDEY